MAEESPLIRSSSSGPCSAQLERIDADARRKQSDFVEYDSREPIIQMSMLLS